MKNNNQKIIPSESGIFTQNKLQLIKRKGKPCIFSERLKKNVTKYLFDFFYMRELSDICSANIFLYNCFREYEISTWKMEMLNLIDIFHLDIKNQKEEVDESLLSCIQKQRLYPMKDHVGSYIRIDKEGINIISLVYYDPDMQKQLDKLTNTINTTVNHFNFAAFELLEMEDEIDENEINPKLLKTPWKVVHSNDSYYPGNIIFLEEKSPLDFGFSFYHVIRGDYKFYIHHNITDMRNANLRIKISINDKVVFEINNFPSKKILEQFRNDNIMDEDDDKNIKLKDSFICDINEHLFDCVKNDLRKSIEIKKNKSIKSEASTDSSQSDPNKNEYTVRISFTNQHLFWKAGWYLDGGRLVRTIYKI